MHAPACVQLHTQHLHTHTHTDTHLHTHGHTHMQARARAHEEASRNWLIQGSPGSWPSLARAQAVLAKARGLRRCMSSRALLRCRWAATCGRAAGGVRSAGGAQRGLCWQRFGGGLEHCRGLTWRHRVGEQAQRAWSAQSVRRCMCVRVCARARSSGMSTQPQGGQGLARSTCDGTGLQGAAAGGL